ncbi:MAG: hypothetical protein ACRC3Y_13070 [Romboutsia sp.]|uniref:hypothetical protein n=1 Tax=Romboutsia sp. TaxID=1965302 RepID=UPI003F2F851D
MDYQITIDNIYINKDKSIGNVLFIVEGSKTEFFIIKKIFKDIFNYTYQSLNRNGKEFPKYQNPNKEKSSVFVINTENSHISSIQNQQQYLDELFQLLSEKYKFDIDNSSIYFIFDRDRDPIDEKEEHRIYIKNLIKNLTNALDIDDNRNDEFKFDRQGLLLLSYPAIEAFTASNFINNSYELNHQIGSQLKDSLESQKINHSKINETTLKNATLEMIKFINTIHNKEFNVDSFSKLSLEIFENQDEFYSNNKEYRIFSSLCVSLIDLGLIDIQEGN